jgi:hypothetical protein
LRYGVLEDAARDGISEREARRLAQQAAEVMRAPTFYRSGDAEEACEYIWALCVGRRPALVELRDGPSTALADALVGDALRESYLRVVLSSLARVATLQEVRMSLERDGEDFVLTETPLPGVYDPQLLRRTQAVVELITAADISFLDFGLLEGPPVGFRGEEYEAEFGSPPGIINYLFYPQPPRAETMTVLRGLPA